MVCNRLWKWLATSLSYPRQYATDLGNRLWKWYVTACLVAYLVMQPFMEMVGKQFSHLWNCAGAVVRQAVLPVYGNGRQAVLPFIEVVVINNTLDSS